ncbi:hypothetical protein MTsPCn9_34560 [Croceitalea sp. MTPC9]|uniref:hypothetical protein n=1 Tax=unclassified Croceitalea TaxID=2632280 RepID=UPI002B3C31B2|nr:hypothetical protein MTsPCn6_34390 [Croceitalea sp. MTPC6]GMN18516.1 hypothetical protein MTsPCn9_34560 [Croceitalea sp. MTPC9]
MKILESLLSKSISLNGVQGMAQQEPSIFDYGEIAIGAGTFILGIVVAITTGYTARRNRKIHIADKRMEWITEFRNTISELISVAYMAAPPHDKEQLKLLERYLTLMNKIDLMGLVEEGPIWNEEHIIFDISEMESFVEGNMSNQNFIELKDRILQKSQRIINEKWDKIKNLES